ncbi:hypothetical protein LJC24_01335 [Desulfococcaceae bacterium OttesenSCG-928-F15]|nr:hypothetical protein [Desulfococcaceae bacterium OttesenSCG-928-F15]
MKKTIALALFPLIFLFGTAYANEWLTFDSQGDPKAKGLWITVKYPKGWDALDDKRPDWVKTFRSRNRIEKTMKLFGLSVMETPKKTNELLESLSHEEWVSLGKKAIPKHAELRSINRIRHEGRSGLLLSFSAEDEKNGEQLYTEFDAMILFSGNKMVALHCSTTGLDEGQIASEHVSNTRAVCLQYFNSLNFN